MTECAALFLGLLGGLAFLLMVLGLFDPRKGLFWMERRTRLRAALIYGGTAVVALILAVLLYQPAAAQVWNERGHAILAQMQADYEAGRYTAVIDSAKRYMNYAEAEAPVEALHDRALEDSLGARGRIDRDAETEKNRDLYRRLVNFDATNERYLSKLIHYEVELQHGREQDRAGRRRQEKSERQSRGVRNYYVVRAVKNRLENPERFEHVETRFADRGDHLYVVMRFRANGSSAADTAYAIVSLEDQLTSLIVE